MISQKAKYAIKALMYLAEKPQGEPVRTIDIAKNARIPKKFLEHILLDLKNATLVSSKQGVLGGCLTVQWPCCPVRRTNILSLAPIAKTLKNAGSGMN